MVLCPRQADLWLDAGGLHDQAVLRPRTRRTTTARTRLRFLPPSDHMSYTHKHMSNASLFCSQREPLRVLPQAVPGLLVAILSGPHVQFRHADNAGAVAVAVAAAAAAAAAAMTVEKK
eukprot:SAG22_NODE_179_length_16124_cov_7.355445_6_plen_118_part_00